MNRHALLAFGVVIIIAAAGAYALRSIDQGQGQSVFPAPDSQQAVTDQVTLPKPVPVDRRPPPAPTSDAPAQPVLPLINPTVPSSPRY